MGRKKVEFTKEQDDRIAQLVNEGYSLNQILPIINGEFNTTFSRSCIDRRIKTLGIERPLHNTIKSTGNANPASKVVIILLLRVLALGLVFPVFSLLLFCCFSFPITNPRFL